VRTALSRAKAEDSLLVEADASGRARYRLSPATFAMGSAQLGSGARKEGFLLAVFSFRAEEGEDRAALRGLLKDYGFRKLAQNAYIHGRIATEGLREAVRELGLESHLFLFTCPDIDDERLIARILELFDLEGRRKELREYLARLKPFLAEGLPPDDLARRLLYVGAVHWERVEAGEPPFPAKFLPSDYALPSIQEFYGRRLEESRELILDYYRRHNP
jgi:DNA-binding transcriptional regulator PaaX